MEAVTGQRLNIREASSLTNCSASGPYVPPGTSSSPIAKWTYHLRAPLRWWKASIVRIAVVELGKLPIRIREYSREPYLRYGFPLPTLDLSDYVSDASDAENRFLCSCTCDIQSLRKDHHWASFLEMQMAAEAYRLGASWAIRSLHNEPKNGPS